MGDTISCVADDGEEEGPVTFSELGDDFVFSIGSCISGEEYDESEKGEFFLLKQQEETPGYMDQQDIDDRLGKLGKKINAFYQVPTGLDKPVGIRKYPHRLSARTGDVLIPGEVRESVQEIYVDGVKFVKIVGPSKGWVFERHPDLGIPMLEYYPGQIIHEHRSYLYKETNATTIQILSGPAENADKTDHVIFQGEEVDVCKIWKPSDGSDSIFAELEDERGWVELLHPITGESLFERIIP